MRSAPIVRVGRALVVAVQEDIDDDSALELSARLAQQVAEEHTAAVVLDLSAAEMVDSFISRVIADVAKVCGLLGAQVTVAGIRPHVAITLVELGLALEGVRTALTVSEALGAVDGGAGGFGGHA